MIESRLESALFWFHVKPAHSHRKTLNHATHASPAVHVVVIGFAVLLRYTELDQRQPKQMYLPRSSASTVCLPSHRAPRTQR